MSTISTSLGLLSRPARSSAGASSFGFVKPAVVALPCAPAEKKRPRSICYSVDAKATDHPFNISPVALVHPDMPSTSTPRWEIKEDGKNVKLTFFNLPEGATTGDFQVAVEDDVLIIRTNKPKSAAAEEQRQREQPPADSVSFHVRLLVPKGYDKESVRAQLQLRALVVTVPKVNPLFTKEVAVDGK
ncbi:small heat shock protein, chloroplastic-like [Miscanthus floridulus]|uniref:small heat shock protein, chloroplastic-like n=1 Tax=Miscanthus floridulus TaxID=154761 RepID=UPI00345983E0